MGLNERAREFRRATQLSAQKATDAQALTMPTIYPDWSGKGVHYGGEDGIQIVRRPSGLYRVRYEHTSQEDWLPELTPSMWKYIDVEHSGTIDDPIPAVVNMEYFKDKYYTEEGKLYLCIRDSEEPLSYLPSQLVGQYFEEVAE